jgi:hypothetical protein
MAPDDRRLTRQELAEFLSARLQNFTLDTGQAGDAQRGTAASRTLGQSPIVQPDNRDAVGGTTIPPKR